MKKEYKILIIILIIALGITSIRHFQNNRKLTERIESNRNFIIGTATRHVPNDWVISVLNKSFDLTDLCKLNGYLRATHGFVRRELGDHDEISNYLWKTQKDIEKLIVLLESNATQSEIDKLKDEIIGHQVKIMEKYHSDFDFRSTW